MSRLLKSIFSALVFSILFVFSVSSIPSPVSAQGIPGISTPVTLTMEPTNPKPFENVSLSLESFSLNVDQATITWLLNGKIIGKGTGLKTMNVQAGALGSSKTVEVVLATKTDGEISQSIVIRPADLTLIWQAASYVPPFYKGKALLPFGGEYKVVALPEILNKNGTKIDPRTLIYTWKKNDAVQQSASGYGKDYFVSTQTSFVREGDDIAVEVTSPTDGFTVSGGVTITPTTPEIHFYEDSPLYGIISERELPERAKLVNEEISVSSEPFYFSTMSKQSPVLTYVWTLNGVAVPDFQNKSSIILRRNGETAGSSEIGLTIGNTLKLLQGADHSIVIQYE